MGARVRARWPQARWYSYDPAQNEIYTPILNELDAGPPAWPAPLREPFCFEPIGATFLGFLPRSGAERESRLRQIADARGATILYEAGILTSWSSTDKTVSTLFYNNLDFYFSFSIGVAIAIADELGGHPLPPVPDLRRRHRVVLPVWRRRAGALVGDDRR